jgi:hypothetical protein
VPPFLLQLMLRKRKSGALCPTPPPSFSCCSQGCEKQTHDKPLCPILPSIVANVVKKNISGALCPPSSSCYSQCYKKKHKGGHGGTLLPFTTTSVEKKHKGGVTWKQCQLFLGEGRLDCVGLLKCASTTLKKRKEKKIYYVIIFVCFWWIGRIWRRIIFEMEENMNNPMRTFQGCVDQIYRKWLDRGILRRGGDYLRLLRKDLGVGGFDFFFCVCEDFGGWLWKFWRAMKEKLWEWDL